MSTDLEQCLEFINEIEKLKIIYRQNMVIDGSRQENSAEHSWHIAIMAIVLSEYSNHENIDLIKVIKMLLIHDIVEIDSGDTFLYDLEACKTKTEREKFTAIRIFGLLPEKTQTEFLNLWKEFEARNTPESKYASALDGLQPLMNHVASQGVGIIKHKITTKQVIESKQHIAEGSRELWEYAKEVIKQSEMAGIYQAGDN